MKKYLKLIWKEKRALEVVMEVEKCVPSGEILNVEYLDNSIEGGRPIRKILGIPINNLHSWEYWVEEDKIEN